MPVVLTDEGANVKGKFTVNLFADTGTTLDGRQVLLATLARNVSLKAGGAKSLTVPLKRSRQPCRTAPTTSWRK